jgi:hypothetical protein
MDIYADCAMEIVTMTQITSQAWFADNALRLKQYKAAVEKLEAEMFTPKIFAFVKAR